MISLSRSRGSLALLLVVSFTSSPQAADGFEKVRCDRPIVSALSGARPTQNEPVVRIEARRKSLGLKHLGTEAIDDGINAIYWQICGRRFVVLDIHDVQGNAVELPPLSRETPEFSTSSCEVSGQELKGDFLGVFARRPSRGERVLPVKVAWRIDRQRNKFVPVDAATTCAASGIFGTGTPG